MSDNNKLYIYRTNFNLTAPVRPDLFKAAQDYLYEDNIVEYIDGYSNELDSLKKHIKSIRFCLKDIDNGYIEVQVYKKLNQLERDVVSEYISGQCSDGIGEGFSCQDFANYDDSIVDWDCDKYKPELAFEDDYEENWIMVEFDWKCNKYELHLHSTANE